MVFHEPLHTNYFSLFLLHTFLTYLCRGLFDNRGVPLYTTSSVYPHSVAALAVPLFDNSAPPPIPPNDDATYPFVVGELLLGGV